MMPLIDPTFTGFVIGEPIAWKSKRQILVNTNNFACGGFGPICIADESFPTVLPPCDEKSKFIMNARRHFAGSFDRLGQSRHYLINRGVPKYNV